MPVRDSEATEPSRIRGRSVAATRMAARQPGGAVLCAGWLLRLDPGLISTWQIQPDSECGGDSVHWQAKFKLKPWPRLGA
jgi:hypothetical protein